MLRSNLSTLRRGIILTGIGTVSVAVLTVIATRIYAERFGADELSSVLVFRLAGSVLLAFSAFGMPVSVQRNVAFLISTPRRAGTSALAGIGLGTGGVGLACAICTLFAPEIARLFGHVSAAALWQSFVALIFAQNCAYLISAVQTARGRIGEATLVTVSAYGLALIVPLLWPGGDSLAKVTFQGALIAGVLAFPSFVNIWKWVLHNGIGHLRAEAGLLLSYGLPRVIGSVIEPFLDLIMSGLALLTADGLKGAGSIAVGLALLKPLNPVMGTLNYVLIPLSARLAADNNLKAQGSNMRQVIRWSLYLGIFATVHLFVWCDLLLELWLGSRYAAQQAEGIGIVRIVCLSFAPTFVYGTVRGMIDGETERPVNTINLVLSLLSLFALAGVTYVLHLGTAGLAAGYLISRLVLMLLTLRYAVQVHSLRATETRLLKPVLVSLGLGLGAVLLRSLFPEGARWQVFIIANSVSGLVLLLSVSPWPARQIINKLRLIS
ncbi:MAG: hypothetical protein U0Z53_15560 [Blastocatellia bacterium]